MMPRSARMTLSSLGCIAALAGCSFEGQTKDSTGEMNMCSAASDCADGSDCIAGMCQAQETDQTLTIALQVTPLHMPNGVDPPLPILLDAFPVREPIKRSFDLKTTIGVGATVRDDEAPIDAEVTFTPVMKIPGIAPAVVTATVTANATPSDSDYSVRLLKGVQYRMIVRPMDMKDPPFAKTITAGTDTDLSVDFAMLETTERMVTISDVPSDRDLLVTAFDPMTGEAVSSTGMVTDGKTTLTFAPDAEKHDYRLEIRASNQYEKDMTPVADEMPCDTDTPAFPVFSVSKSLLETAGTGPIQVVLPPQPERIRYAGTVELCPGNDPKDVTDLPITLHAQSLLFDEVDEVTDLAASFDTTTSANYDKATNALHFCVEVMPGDFDVVATPPAGMSCALFAERRTIKAPSKDADLAGTELITLPKSAYLGGTLQTMGPAPLGGASVDAIALGRSGVIQLPAMDQSVTRYNRTSQTTTGDDGTFKLPVDLGSYDIVIKPPVDSGFPWQVNSDVEIGVGAPKASLNKTIDMPSPVVVTGTLRYPTSDSAAQSTLAGAEIDAYAIISACPPGQECPKDLMRAVAIGKAIADSDNTFMLLLPPKTLSTW